jgi:hypothetical protein
MSASIVQSSNSPSRTKEMAALLAGLFLWTAIIVFFWNDWHQEEMAGAFWKAVEDGDLAAVQTFFRDHPTFYGSPREFVKPLFSLSFRDGAAGGRHGSAASEVSHRPCSLAFRRCSAAIAAAN